MKKHLIAGTLFCTMAACMQAENIDIKTFGYAGPYPVQMPFMADSVDLNGKSFKAEQLLDTPPRLETAADGRQWTDAALPGSDTGYALHLLHFRIDVTEYTTASVHIKGLKDFRLFVDGERKDTSNIVLVPATHTFHIKYLSEAGRQDSLSLSVETKRDSAAVQNLSAERLYDLTDVMLGERIYSTSISPSGKYIITTYYTNQKGGGAQYIHRLTEAATGRILAETGEQLTWLPKSDQYYFTRRGARSRQLMKADPATGQETVWAEGLPEGYFRVAPTEDFLLFSQTQEGPKKNKDVYEIAVPDDRQPGWRNRSYFSRFDLSTGLLQRLTYGYHNMWVTDISDDGRYLLFMKSEQRLGERPTTLTSLYRMNLETLETELLADRDGFIGNALFSPDGQQVVVVGSAEAFGGAGKRVKDGQTPNMVENRLFLLDAARNWSVTPVEPDFKPSAQKLEWSRDDGMLYFTAEDRDCVKLFRLNPADGKIRAVPVEEDLVGGFTLSQRGHRLAWFGQSASNFHRRYVMNTKSMKSELKEDLHAALYKDIVLGSSEEWNFVSSRGDTIYGRCYLPPHFDASKKYPVIVYYYGGCSPSPCSFNWTYPLHLYAAQGYVAYLIQPSGATGMGQEFAARHVNTAGEGVADDIIEGTRRFVAEHPYADSTRIGCIGASYGGFMTQYLQTKTDLFAAAISHAGISDHTSYWGEGYWGYSYSEVSMAGSYPWTRRDLFVDRSPLYNADKIHTPLLFLHGTDDTNVPIGESIQMFTALKLLGRETAFVAVKDQDHHILDYAKRRKWQDTIFAWFAKYLKDDASLWDAMYPPLDLEGRGANRKKCVYLPD